ncbi:hypothetical protein ACI2KG_16065 [Pseudomonas sp. NPDC089407]|uniref:hypothetical protein n=1 Tax=Pseudomonas sp. NPDC089407 TaxID=3364464 RepID=UPI00384DFC98
MRWQNSIIDGRERCMAHLRPATHSFEISSRVISVDFTFGFHCFTDNKNEGPLITNPRSNEQRNFSQSRYDCSKLLPEFVARRFVDAKVRAHFAGRNNRRYFCLDTFDYAIFFEVRKLGGKENHLRVNVISAYQVDAWGRTSMPKGQLFNVRYILEKRNEGLII